MVKTGLPIAGMGWQAAIVFLLWLSCAGGAETVIDLDFPNPLGTAKKGQWVVYRVAGRVEQKSTIADIDADGGITIKIEQKIGDSHNRIGESKVTRKDAAYPKKRLRVNADLLDVVIENGGAQVAGAPAPVMIVQYTTKAGTSEATRHRLLLSENVPIYGEVLVASGVFPYPASELLAFDNLDESGQ